MYGSGRVISTILWLAFEVWGRICVWKECGDFLTCLLSTWRSTHCWSIGGVRGRGARKAWRSCMERSGDGGGGKSKGKEQRAPANILPAQRITWSELEFKKLPCPGLLLLRSWSKSVSWISRMQFPHGKKLRQGEPSPSYWRRCVMRDTEANAGEESD